MHRPHFRRIALAAAASIAAAAAAPACGQEGPGAEPPPAAAPKAAEAEKWERTATGLEYQVLAAGKEGGASPKDGEFVVCSYKGWLENGKVFDESARHGGPARFQVGSLVAGWNEALKMMRAGAKWKLRVPPELGYGDRGAGDDIPPKSVLYFELEVHEVVSMPVFVKPNPQAQKTTASGLKWEVVKEGAGEGAGPDDVMEIRFAFFSPAGKLMDCSEKGRTIRARRGDLSFPFLKEGTALLKTGARYRFEVPPALAFGAQARGPDLPANSTTYWELELVSVTKPLAVPSFEAPDEAKMTALPSGLKIQTVKEGTGAAPKLGQTVRVHYAGWLLDGTLFDSSYGRGEPAEFQLGQVIEGWNEGLQTMRPGGVARLVIPSKLAYGEQAVGDKIKPGSTLVFLVELLDVK